MGVTDAIQAVTGASRNVGDFRRMNESDLKSCGRCLQRRLCGICVVVVNIVSPSDMDLRPAPFDCLALVDQHSDPLRLDHVGAVVIANPIRTLEYDFINVAELIDSTPVAKLI